MILRLADYRCI